MIREDPFLLPLEAVLLAGMKRQVEDSPQLSTAASSPSSIEACCAREAQAVKDAVAVPFWRPAPGRLAPVVVTSPPTAISKAPLQPRFNNIDEGLQSNDGLLDRQQARGVTNGRKQRNGRAAEHRLPVPYARALASPIGPPKSDCGRERAATAPFRLRTGDLPSGDGCRCTTRECGAETPQPMGGSSETEGLVTLPAACPSGWLQAPHR